MNQFIDQTHRRMLTLIIATFISCTVTISLLLLYQGIVWDNSIRSRLSPQELFILEFVESVMRHDQQVIQLVSGPLYVRQIEAWVNSSEPTKCIKRSRGISGLDGSHELVSVKIECNNAKFPYNYVYFEMSDIDVGINDNREYFVRGFHIHDRH